MWNGLLGRIGAPKHRIDRTPENSQPIHSVHYCVDPKDREFERMEIGKMLLQRVIKPAKTKQAAPIVFHPKKEGSLRFYVV